MNPIPRSWLLAVACWVGVAGACCAGSAALDRNAAPRDVIASAFLYPFVTSADVVKRWSDTRAEIAGAEGGVLFRYPGIRGVLVDGEQREAERVGRDVVRVNVGPGTHEIRVVTTGVVPSRGQSESVSPAAVAPEQVTDRFRQLVPGDILVVRDGVYRDTRLELVGDGQAGKPIGVRPETPGGVVFRGRTQIRLSGRHLVLRGFRFEHCGPGVVVGLYDADDCRVTQCQFLGCGNPQSTFGHIVQIGRGSDRNRVDHCFFTGSKSMSLAQRVRTNEVLGRDNLFDHNVFRDIYRYWINGQENIQLGQNQRGASGDLAPHCTVAHNLFDHAWGDGEIMSNKCSNNTIRANTAAHCYHSAFTLRGGNRVRFEANVMAHNGDGLRVMGTRHTIVNNLFLDHPRCGILFETGHRDGESNVASVGSLVAHNTFVRCYGAAVSGVPTTTSRPHAPTANRFVQNLVLSVGLRPFDTRHMVSSTVERNLFWRAGRERTRPGLVGTGDDAVVAEPLLEGEGSALRCAARSPAIDRGHRLTAVTRDRHGLPRDTKPDIGADEWTAGAAGRDALAPPIPPRPLLAPGLYCGEQVFVQAGPVAGRPDESLLADSEVTLSVDVPGDVVMSWEQQNVTFDATATLAWDTDGQGCALLWGGADNNGRPNGLVTLKRSPDGLTLAETADVLHYRYDYTYKGRMGFEALTERQPDPKRWYRFTLLKCGGRLVLLLADRRHRLAQGMPVLVWTAQADSGQDRARPMRVRISQAGRGNWRNFSIRRYTYTGHTRPAAPTVQVASRGNCRVALRWGARQADGCRFRVSRCQLAEANSRELLLADDLRTAGYDDFNVGPETNYRYRIVSVNPFGLESEPAVVDVRTAQGGAWYQVIPAAAVTRTVAPLQLSRSTDLPVLRSAGAAAAMSGAPAEGQACFDVSLAEETTIAVWGLVHAPNDGANSFHIAVNPQRLSDYRVWHVGVHPGWGWSRAAEGVALSAGTHRIILKHREPNTELRALMLTTDLDFQPAD